MPIFVTMDVIARVVILIFSAAAIGFIIATSATQDSVTKSCTLTLNRPITASWPLPVLTEFPMPSTGLFIGKLTVAIGDASQTERIETKDLIKVNSLFESAQAFAILSVITFFAASCVHVAQFVGVVPQGVGRFAGFIHLFGALFAVICGSILLGAVHRNVVFDQVNKNLIGHYRDYVYSRVLFHSSDANHSLSECSLNYGIPFIFVAAGLGFVNCFLFFLTGGWTAAADVKAYETDNTADVEAEVI